LSSTHQKLELLIVMSFPVQIILVTTSRPTSLTQFWKKTLVRIHSDADEIGDSNLRLSPANRPYFLSTAPKVDGD
jgi:hypothetical protein